MQFSIESNEAGWQRVKNGGNELTSITRHLSHIPFTLFSR
jgi:hypothetical protein